MELCTSKQHRLIRVLVDIKSVNQSESCLLTVLKPKELEFGPCTGELTFCTFFYFSGLKFTFFFTNCINRLTARDFFLFAQHVEKLLRALVTDEKDATTVTSLSVAMETVNVVEKMENLTLVGFNHISSACKRFNLHSSIIFHRGSKHVASKHC